MGVVPEVMTLMVCTDSPVAEGTTALVRSRREQELAAMIAAYNQVAEKLKQSHVELNREVRRLRKQLAAKDLELARKQRLAALGEMAAGLAHEIRNPLSGIGLFASLLARDLRDDDRALGIVHKISRGVSTVEAIISDVLAFAGQGTPSTEEVDIGLLLPEALELLAAPASSKGVELEWDDALRGKRVRANAAQLQRALMNLIDNAIDASPPDHTVRIELDEPSTDAGRVTLAVCDHGPGVPPDARDRIFNPFFTTKDKGTGLGLAIVHRIAEAHGGSVRAVNGASGGARFLLTLPAAE